jgi:hypothetical protein
MEVKSLSLQEYLESHASLVIPISSKTSFKAPFDLAAPWSQML